MKPITNQSPGNFSPPRTLRPFLFLGLALAGIPVLSAASVTLPAQYKATGNAWANFDLGGNISMPDAGGIPGTAEITVTLGSGYIVFDEISATLPSSTWTDSGSFLNPAFQTIGVTVEIVTNPTTFIISTNRSLALTPNSNGELTWDSGTPEFQGMISLFLLSGSYTVTGETEIVTGEFSHWIGSRGMISSGKLRAPNFPDEIEIEGGLHTLFPSTFTSNDLSLVNATVDGVHISISTFGIRSGMGGSGGSEPFTFVPEPSAIMLLAFAGAGLACRRRRHG